MTYETIEIRPVTPLLGAEVDGVDLTRTLAPLQVRDIQHALLAHQVLFFRNQRMTFERHKEFIWRPPLGGSVALVELPKGWKAEEYCRRLATDEGVVLLPSSFLGIEDRYVRFGFGRKNFEEALAAYEKVLERDIGVNHC